MKPSSRSAAACRTRLAANRSTIAASLLAVCLLAGGAAPLVCDSLSFVSHGNSRYQYKAEASDNRWDPGDIIVLSGLEQVTGAEGPKGFTVELSPYTVTWTCIELTHGKPHFDVYSVAAEGDSPYIIASSDPGSGSVTGPAYVPEPMTIALFGGGLLTLAAALRRRRSLAPHHGRPRRT
jgi:hypothetical protein